MKKINWYAEAVKKLGLFVVTALIFFPGNVFAHDVLSQSATKLNENTFLFQITYRLNYLTYDTFAPILATQVSEVSTSSPYLGYSFVDEAGKNVGGVNSAAIVLSEAEIVDKQYYFADKNSSTFTLLSVVTLAPELVNSANSLALQIDWLPFSLRKDGEIQNVGLIDSNLTKYKTSSITW